MSSAPSQGKDLLEGVYQTPLDLLRPINGRWPIGFDLAAHRENNAAWRLHGLRQDGFYSEADDALSRTWYGLCPGAYAWCNPPYDDLGAWTRKAKDEAERGARFLMLLPSATGARWLVDNLLQAKIVFLVGRPVFEFINPMSHKNPEKRGKPNTDPYGKDMLLAVFDGTRGIEWWNWKR